jgi:hypothetical protein
MRIEMEEDEIGLRKNLGHIELVNVGERNKIIIDVLNDGKGSRSFC